MQVFKVRSSESRRKGQPCAAAHIAVVEAANQRRIGYEARREHTFRRVRRVSKAKKLGIVTFGYF